MQESGDGQKQKPFHINVLLHIAVNDSYDNEPDRKTEKLRMCTDGLPQNLGEVSCLLRVRNASTSICYASCLHRVNISNI